MSAHDICRIVMAAARAESVVPIPKGLHAESCFGDYFYVYSLTDLIWEGEACCKWDARACALDSLQPKKDLEKT